MASVGTVKARIQRILIETDGFGEILQQNFYDAELYDYFNKALEILSIELAKMGSALDIPGTSLTFTSPAHSQSLADLSPSFLTIATNNKAEPRIFNTSVNGYPRLTRADEEDVDSWESEDDEDVGVPTQYYLRGLTLYIHPRPATDTTIKLYYHPLRQISSDTDDLPWNGLFDSAIERFVVAQCRMRAELSAYNPALDMSMTENLRRQAWDTLFHRQGGVEVAFAAGHGWDI